MSQFYKLFRLVSSSLLLLSQYISFVWINVGLYRQKSFMYQAMSVLLYGCTIQTLMKHSKKKNRCEIHKDATCWKQHPTKQQLYSHLLPIIQTIQVRQGHAGHSWRSKDKFIRDVLLRTPTHGHTSVNWPKTTNIHQLCADTGCRLEDLSKAGKRVKGICAVNMPWWWWWWWWWCVSSRLTFIFQYRHETITCFQISVRLFFVSSNKISHLIFNLSYWRVQIVTPTKGYIRKHSIELIQCYVGAHVPTAGEGRSIINILCMYCKNLKYL